MFHRRRRPETDFSEELRAHLELETDRLREQGFSDVDARAMAHRNLGNILSIEERFYQGGRWMWLDHLWQDLHYASRQLRSNKAFTVVCTLTLALGIGANTAIFTLVHAVMLKSLPVTDPKALYSVGDGGNCCVIGGYQNDHSIFSYSLYQYLRDHTPEFAETAGFQASPNTMSVRQGNASAIAQPFVSQFVSGNYFATFGVRAYAGRAIQPTDDVAGARPVAIMSYRAWQKYHALDPAVIGSVFVIDGTQITVVGIAPPGFYGDTLRQNPPDFWIPLAVEPVMGGQSSILNSAGTHWLYIIGRLKPGARPERVETELNVELKQWLMGQAGSKISVEDTKAIAKQHIRLMPGGGGVARMQQDAAEGFRLIFIASGLVLLIACANLATMVLGRKTACRIQNAVRLALGAPRRRLMYQSLIESVLLALFGGVAGLAVAFAGAHAMLALAFQGAKFVPIDAAPSLPVLGFAFLLSLVTGVVFGLLPAWVSAGVDPADALRGGNRIAGSNATFLQKSLVVLQATLSVVLLCGAGLLLESLRNLEHQRFGFQTKDRLIVAVSPAFTGYTQERVAAIYREIRQRLEQIPGVESTSLSGYAPMSGNNMGAWIAFEGRPFAERQEDRDHSSWVRVSPHYFETIGSQLLRGRLINEHDTPASRQVAVVSEAFARKYFKNQNPLGRHFGLGDASHSLDYEIVGVVQDTKWREPSEPAGPMFFLPLMQVSAKEWQDKLGENYIGDIEIHTHGNSASIAPLVRTVIAQVEPNLTVIDILPFEELVSLTFNNKRLIARLTSAFSFLALLLACIGLYGITAYSVARRTGEIGIRIALGAAGGRVVAMVLRDALVLTAVGLAIGIPGELALGRLLANQLYGIKSYDPVILGGAAFVLAACAIVAGLLPARRAASIEPMDALRAE
jgi:predicted permease